MGNNYIEILLVKYRLSVCLKTSLVSHITMDMFYLFIHSWVDPQFSEIIINKCKPIIHILWSFSFTSYYSHKHETLGGKGAFETQVNLTFCWERKPRELCELTLSRGQFRLCLSLACQACSLRGSIQMLLAFCLHSILFISMIWGAVF